MGVFSILSPQHIFIMPIPWSILLIPRVMAGFPLVQHGLAEFHNVQALMNHGHAVGRSFGFGRDRGGGGATETGKQQQGQEVGGGFDGWF